VTSNPETTKSVPASATPPAGGPVAAAHFRMKEAQLRAVFENAGIGIAVSSLDGRFLEANPRFCQVLGYSAEALSQLTFLDVTHPDDVEATRARSHDLVTGRFSSLTLEKRYVRGDGRSVWCNTSVSLLRAEDGSAAQFIGVVEDISHRKEAEEARDHLAAVVQHSSDAVITKTLDGFIRTWNPAAESIFGYRAEEVIGRPVTLLMPPAQADEEPALLAKIRRGERVDHYETIRRRKDGSLINISLSLSPLKDSSGRIVGASKIARDITRQKRVEEELKAQTEALRQMDQRKNEFLATLSHELRNPLAPIKQAAVIAALPGASEDQKRWATDVIRRQVHNMSLLLDDLLDVSRITHGTLELRIGATDLFSVIKAAVETSQPLIDMKRHRLQMQLPREPVQFAADSLRLAQVLSNLLTNAAKYTDAGGRIRVVASVENGAVTLRVEDNGIGIAAESMSRIFRMFSQLAEAHERSEGGLGIGLALAKGLTELHGGTLRVESPGLGLGSTFIVTLPLRSISTEAGGAQRVPVASIGPGKRRVLVADDNRDAANSLAMLLRMEGHEVEVVHDGVSAIEGIRTSRPDVAILDIGMPGMDGYQVARLAREAFAKSELTLVAVTGWGQKNDVERAMASGFDHHFTKPLEPSSLAALLQAES
jgi:PAS domain S-box-containing protein